jgi:hypothetical protein
MFKIKGLKNNMCGLVIGACLYPTFLPTPLSLSLSLSPWLPSPPHSPDPYAFLYRQLMLPSLVAERILSWFVFVLCESKIEYSALFPVSVITALNLTWNRLIHAKWLPHMCLTRPFFLIFFLNLNYFFIFKLFWHADIKNKFRKIKNYFDVFLNKKYFEKQFLPYFQTGP